MTDADGPVPATGTATALRALAAERATTLLTALAAGVHALLTRHSGGDDACTAWVRPALPGAKGTIVVLRCAVDEDLPFTALMDLVHVCGTATRNDNAGGPPPRAVVLLREDPLPGQPVVDSPSTDELFAEVPLVVEFRQRGGELLTAVHQRSAEDTAGAEQLRAHLPALLAAVAGEPWDPLWTKWPQDGVERTPPELFAEHVRRHGESPAVRWRGQTTTYRELDARAERIAALLTATGVQRGDRVCMIGPPGPRATEALLAMARLGVCSIGLEPDVPPERLRIILADCHPRLVVVTDTATRPDTGGVPLCDIGVLPAVASSGPVPAPRRAPGPRDPLCCVYTSGTTGRPKGVVLTHGGLANLVSWHRLAFGPAEGRRCGQVAGLAFDASLWEMWSALCLGGCLCIADPSLRSDFRMLSRWIVKEELGVCFLPTATAQRLLSSGALSGAHHLSHLMVGGDKLAAFPDCLPFTAVNVYGPTEASVCATWWRHDGSSPPPIGRPLPNICAYVLDRDLHPVPTGRVGELHLSGTGIAQGYLGEPGMTASRFVADPFGPPGTRMYRTGDQVSRSLSGVLHFRGRADRQVKVRGTRVELDEIELVLTQHAAVLEAAVVCDGGSADDPAVTACVVTAPGEDLDLTALRAWLRDRLPAAMVPALVTRLPTMPRTPGGKIDRRALVGLPAGSAMSGARGRQPRTDEERSVQAQWTAVLGHVVGIDENYFDVGGSSINLMELRWRLEHLCGVSIPLAQLFRHTTIAAMATLLEHRPTPGATGHDDLEL